MTLVIVTTADVNTNMDSRTRQSSQLRVMVLSRNSSAAMKMDSGCLSKMGIY